MRSLALPCLLVSLAAHAEDAVPEPTPKEIQGWVELYVGGRDDPEAYEGKALAVDSLRDLDDDGFAVAAGRIEKAFEHPSPGQRERACGLAQQLGRRAERFLPTVDKLVDDKVEAVRMACAASILRLHAEAERDLPPALDRRLDALGAAAERGLAKAKRSEDRVVWLRRLAELSPYASSEAVAAVASLCGEADEAVRDEAFRALEEVIPRDPPAALPALLAALDHPARHDAVRRAVSGLREAPAAPAIAQAFEAELASPKPVRRAGAARLLGDLAPTSPAVGQKLLPLLADPDEAVRHAAAHALGKFGAALTPQAKTAVPLLITYLAKDGRGPGAGDGEVGARTAIAALLPFAPEGVERLVALTLDEAYGARWAALFAALKPSRKMAAPLYAKVLADDARPVEVRARAARLCGELEADALSALPALAAAVDAKDETLRRSAVAAFESLKAHGAPAAGKLASLLGRPSADVRLAALDALRPLGEKGRGVSAKIAPLLDDAEPGVRAAAAWTLSAQGALPPELAAKVKRELEAEQKRLAEMEGPG